MKLYLVTVVVFNPIQKYKFESKSQQKLHRDASFAGCSTQYKNTNLKANHNL